MFVFNRSYLQDGNWIVGARARIHCSVTYVCVHTHVRAQMSTARAISVILSDSGCADHDGRVVSQLVDFATRYVADVVSAMAVCTHYARAGG
jgi:hypothetical protein